MIEKSGLCKMIKEQRKNLGLTQEQLAQAVMVDRTYICAIENERRFPSWELMWQLAEFLDIEIGRQHFRLTK